MHDVRHDDLVEFRDIIHQEFGRGGSAQVAEILGKRPTTILNEWNPNYPSHQPRLFEWVTYMVRTKNTETLQWVCRMMGGYFIQTDCPDVLEVNNLLSIGIAPIRKAVEALSELERSVAPDSDEGEAISPSESLLTQIGFEGVVQSALEAKETVKAVTNWPDDEKRRR